MASEEERARIMAEYLAGNDEAEEEEEFQDDDDDEPTAAANFPVLKGRLKLDGLGHLVYLGTWSMKQDSVPSDKTKFKLKSTTPVPKFNLNSPSEKSAIAMNGYFHTDHTDKVEQYRKIKERGIQLAFTKQQTGQYRIKGKGSNEFGAFTLEGLYVPDPNGKKYWLQCNKQYGFTPSYDEDEDCGDDEGADIGELTELQHDAQMSVEDLRKKYYGGDNDDVNDSKPPAAKKPKIQITLPVDDDDDECGF
jgi:hypothetical protein